jgi:transposase
VKQNQTLYQCTVIERDGQQVFTLNSEIFIPEDAPVRLTNAQLEELDYRKLYEAYSSKGRKSVTDPRVLFKLLVYGYQCGIYSTRKLEEACRYRIDFQWLLWDEPVPDHSTISRFRTGRCAEAVEDLFYQYVRYLETQGETDHETVFIDGTKLESRAGRYTFVWRKSIEKHLSKVKAKVYAATSLTSLEALDQRLAELETGISFVHSAGHRKSEAQKEWETLDELRRRWQEYEEKLAIMGDGRNSYSKTDPDATFMRMKDDHMRNGQLKPGYNVQIGVNSEYITGIEAFSSRTDYGTMVPFMKTMQRHHGKKYKSATADAGYERLSNYLYLEANGQMSFIKPANYEQQKSSSFKQQIGRMENMVYDAEDDSYTCSQGRKLNLRRECTELQNGRFITTAWYRCESCSGCPVREKCCQAKDADQPKELRVNKTLQELRKASLENITTEQGIYLRLCRSIQVEGAFGLLKNDFGFRRFLTRGKKNIRTELFFLALAFNLKKLWMKRDKGRLRTHLSEISAA